MILASAITAIMALSGLLLSLAALFQARLLLQNVQKRSAGLWTQQETRMGALQSALESVAADVRELQARPGGGPVSWKAGLNLNKRSQALRMHRRGQTTEQIALALDVPAQEVELLIKVHRIVLSSI